MGNLKSEIYFNRSLLWLAIAYIRLDIGYNNWLALVFLVPCAVNIWRSYEAWGDEK